MLKFFGHDKPFDILIDHQSENAYVGACVSFPTTPETLGNVFQQLGIGLNDWAITSVDSQVPGIENAIQNCQNLDELNYLAVKLVDMSEAELDIFTAVIDADQHCETLEDLINLCDNLDCFYLDEDIRDYDELGRDRLLSSGAIDRRTLEELEDFIDYEGYGHRTAVQEDGFMAGSGYLVPSGITFVENYQGRPGDIPEEYLVTTKLFVPELTEDERMGRAMELAVELDNFFRVFDPEYAVAYPDAYMRQEDIFDRLYEGKIAAFDKMLDDLGQGERDPLPMELAEYKAAIRYDPAQDVEPEKLRVLMVEPRKAPYVKEIDPGLASLQHEVSGTIQAAYPFDDPVGLISNDESKLLGMELNRALYDGQGRPYDVIAGPFMVVGLEDDHFASLTGEQIDKFSRRFQAIEVYAQVEGRTIMFQVPQNIFAHMSDKDLDDVIRSRAEKKPSVRERLTAVQQESHSRPHAPKRDEPER